MESFILPSIEMCYHSHMKENMERGDIDSEFNDLFRKEGARAAQAGIERDEMRLGNMRKTMRVLERFMDDGLTEGMPLGEALKFLEVKLDLKNPETPVEDAQAAYDFLSDIVGAEYPSGMPLGQLMNKFKEEEQELLAGR
jgi:hypothetical protein